MIEMAFRVIIEASVLGRNLMDRPLRLGLLSILFICFLFLSHCGIARAEGALQVSGQLALADPLIGDLDSEPAMILAQKAIRQAPSRASEEESSAVMKSPGKAFFFSLLAPGSGQLYVGAKRGYIFLGVEAIAWTSSYFLWKSGKQKKDEYQGFADTHWEFPVPGEPCNDAIYDSTADRRIRDFYAYDKEHFYEDIGKYPFYTCGWDSPENLNAYLDMRDDSNWLLKSSNYAIMAALINHVVSAIDALRLARNYNVSLGYGMNLDLKFKASPHSTGVILVAARKF